MVTGLGVVAPNGIGRDAYWETILSGRSQIREITLFDTYRHPCKIAGEITDFDPVKLVNGAVRIKREARHTQMALAAVRMAMEDAALDLETQLGQWPIALCVGVSGSAPDLFEQGMKALGAHGPEGVSPFVAGSSTPQAVSTAIRLTLQTPVRSMLVSSACAAGLDAISQASQLIRSRQAEIAIAGAADAPITEAAFSAFLTAGLVAPTKGDPAKACRPFDALRDAGVIGEGAAFVVLETADRAAARGAVPYAVIEGCGSTIDSDPSKPGHALAESMEAALADACCLPSEIDYVCAHGPGHLVLDRVETGAIKKALGPHAQRIPVSSIKGTVGNALSAAGPMQFIATALAIRHGEVPPTANYEYPDLQCDLDIVAAKPRRAALRRALVNTHGIGGPNRSLILGSAAACC